MDSTSDTDIETANLQIAHVHQRTQTHLISHRTSVITVGCTNLSNVTANAIFTGDICSSAAFTSGVNFTISGNISAVAAITLGANTIVNGSIHAGGAITLGTNSTVSGTVLSDIHNVTLGANATIGSGGPYLGGAGGTVGTTLGTPIACVDITNVVASTIFNGDICSSVAFTSGASSQINGNVQAVAAITLGASCTVTGSLQAGAAITTGAGSTVSGNIHAAAAITLGANSHITGSAISDIGTITYGAGATVGSA